MSPSHKVSLPTVNDCSGCGACCLHMGYPAFVTGGEGQEPEINWVSLPSDLRAELESYASSYAPPNPGQLDGVCFWFDKETRLCKHHQHRPNVCRDFQVGSEDCLGWREHYRDHLELP